MNTFEYSFYIGEKLYNVYVDSSQEKKKRIVINNRELVNENYTLSFNRKAYMIYYPIELDGDILTVSIYDLDISHKYNLYLNGISLLDQTHINETYDKANAIINKGFTKFAKTNWLETLKYNIGKLYYISLLGGITAFAVEKIWLKTLVILLLASLTLPLFLWIDWLCHKDTIKKYDACFRPTIQFKYKDSYKY